MGFMSVLHVGSPIAVQFYLSTTRHLTDRSAVLPQYTLAHRLQCSFTSVLHVSSPIAVQFYVSTTQFIQLTDRSAVLRQHYTSAHRLQ